MNGTVRTPLAALFVALLLTPAFLFAQTFPGNNNPGGSSSFSVPVAGTNLSITVPGTGSTYSFVYIKKGGAATETDYDFSSALVGVTNSIHLASPEFSAGTYSVRVVTPASSSAHSFSLLVETNSTDLGSAARPISKPLGGAIVGGISANTRQYYRFEVKSSGALRVFASSTHTFPDVYVQRGQLPTDAAYIKRSIGQTNDLIPLLENEGVAGSYFVGVFAPGGTPANLLYTLQMDAMVVTSLTWDPGLTPEGTIIHSDFTGVGGSFFFRIATANPALGAWRTALKVLEGEANIYMSRGVLPLPSAADFKSERVGSDGFVLGAHQFAPSEVWYILVQAVNGARWSLVSGAPYVQDLGSIAQDDSTGSGNVVIGPEGIRYFSATTPTDMLAWRLWLNGATNQIIIKKASLPVPGPLSTDITQTNATLVVPPYLTGGQKYFIGVVGSPGSTNNLDSRYQTIIDLPYGSGTGRVVTDFPYTTYRVQVPAQQIAWQISLPSTNGNPNVAVRRNTVPNENYNEALSELSTNVTDNIALVPPILSDGTFYVTVWGASAHQFSLQSGPAAVTDINYFDTVTNDDTNRVGWKYYRVTDINQQLGSLGWELVLTNFSPGTRIAIRRNAAPSTWIFRTPNLTTVNYYDLISSGEALQQPGHQADVWYIGVYNPSNALGAFTLTTRELGYSILTNGVAVTRTNRPAGLWEFFRVDVPATVGGKPVLGWDVRVTNVLQGFPNIVVRRDALPSTLNTTVGTAGTNWPSGGSWAASSDWTQRPYPNIGSTNENGRILTLAMGRPLEPGTYYIGVVSPTVYTNAMAFSLVSRWIGPDLTIPVQPIAFANGAVTNSVAPREADYYSIIVPPNTPSWKVRLTPISGEVMMVAATNRLPNILSEKRVQKIGKEHYVLLPMSGQTNLPAGTNYIVVAGEGVNPPDSTHLGIGSSSYVLETLGHMPEIELGDLNIDDLVTTGTLDGGESAAYHFTPLPGTLGFWITLEDRVGNPVAVSRGGPELADPGSGTGFSTDPYGNEGGQVGGTVASSSIITVADPFARETIMVKARGSSGVYSDASYTLRVREIVPAPISFDGTSTNIIGADPVRGVYFEVTVPQGAIGWDLRLTNVTSGDPVLVVARGFLPIFPSTTPGFLPDRVTDWPVGSRWAAGRDWTERLFSPTSDYEGGRILAMGIGRPLHPGKYYIAVLSSGSEPMSFTLVSRGVGNSLAIPVTPLAFSNGIASVNGLAPREAAYFAVDVPADVPSWKVRLSATAGESMLVAFRGTIPNVLATVNGSVTNSGGRKMQKVGDEHFLLLPPAGATNVMAGTYYLAVIGEGVSPQGSSVGAGVSSFTITSVGPAPVRHLGLLGSADLVETNDLAAGDVQIYQFTVPPATLGVEARLDDRVGNPVMVLRQGERYPDPGMNLNTIPVDPYGHDNGETTALDVHPSLASLANITNQTCTLMVMARSTAGVFSNASYTLRLNASGTLTVNFDDDSRTITNQAAQSWRYFRIAIPTNALGWDLRVINVSTGMPRLVIRRESLPSQANTAPWSSPGSQPAWPTNYQWAPGQDWTRRSQSFDNANISEDGRVFACGMGRPLEPGTYYVGVYNSSPNIPTAYTLLSRGIGSGYALPVVDVPFNGSAAGTNGAREAAYFRVVVPSNSPSWKVKATAVAGEVMMVGLRGFLPNIEGNQPSSQIASGRGMQKPGNEHFVLLPANGLTNVTPGTNYFAVISEGLNPAGSTRIGSGSSSFIFESEGTLATNDLGLLTSEDIVFPDTVEGGEVKLYQFAVPPGMLGLRVRLENRVGNPTAVLRHGDKTPDPGAAVPNAEAYGNEGGYTTTDGSATLYTLPNPLPGIYTLVVKGRAVGTAAPDASFTLRLQEILVPEFNFSPDLNTNGLANSVGGILDDNERIFFKFNIPADINGVPVVGWKLDLVQSSGLASMRVRRDLLPADINSSSLMPFASAQAIVVPPFLTNGVFYVEVKGAGSTAFTLTSSPLLLERPAWQMPSPGQPTITPGVTAPFFGDTGIGTNGAPLPSDGQGTELRQGFLHYYAVEVPGTNFGLLRAALEALSGNPDLYLRYGAPPTLHHGPSGASGTIFDRSMLANATEYANWIPIDGKLEARLKPGLWYMAVRAAGNANAHYRLKLSIGSITDVPVHGDVLTNQLLAAGDWRYYRFVAPATVPGGFNLSFSQESGDVVVYSRDTVPPGNGITGANSDIKDWTTDLKNHGPYGSFDPAGNYSFNAAPVRPDQIYYFGVRAVSDAVFSVRVHTNGFANVAIPTIEFYGGVALTNLPPFSQALYRVDVPAEATRWKHVATHVAGVGLYIEQGTLPVKASTDDWRSSVANSTLNQYLLGSWPWVPGQPYFLLISNATPDFQDVVFQMDGKNAVTDDNDNDALPDAWELTYFGTTGAQSSAGDPDRDGVTNYEEYQEGTNPNDGTVFRPRLVTAAMFGSILRDPNAPSYELNSEVTLTPVPAPGYSFVGWTGSANGRENPLVLTMNGHKTIGATFKLAGDDFVTALPLSGGSLTALATNVGMSKEPGEPNHAGNPGGKSVWWRWTAPSSGLATVTTAGSALNTVLAAYTGSSVSNLTWIASDYNSGGTSNRSIIKFSAAAGTTYYFAVDGYNGASSRIALSLQLGSGQAPTLRSMVRLVAGRARFTIAGDANTTYTISTSTNLTTWTAIGPVTTDSTGVGQFTDGDAASSDRRFYRANQ